MVKNRYAALVYRIVASIIAISGVVVGSGFQKGFVRFLYYTQQSNILTALLFIFLTIKTIIDIKKCGKYGCSDNQRMHMAVTLTVLFTFLIFWAVLAPFAKDMHLFCYGNLCVHCFTPILALADYILFTGRGRLRLKDVFLCCLVPSVYVLEAIVYGLMHIEFYTLNGVTHYFPYFFMDFYFIGWYALPGITAVALLFCFCAFIFYRIDKRHVNRSLRTKSTKYKQ